MGSHLVYGIEDRPPLKEAVPLGIVPKVGAAFATIPAPVIGGWGLMMFAMIFASGAAIGLGLGVEREVELAPGCL